MKKIAMPIENGELSHHFGHSRLFHFFEIEGASITRSYTDVPPPHEEGVIPRWLISEGVTDLLVGGIGPKAINILYEQGMNVYVGVAVAAPDALAADFINENLQYGQNYCHH